MAMISEIRQNGETVLWSEDKCTIAVILNNLCGKNFSGDEYRTYIRYVAFRDMGFKPGEIEHVRDGKVVDKGVIPNIS